MDVECIKIKRGKVLSNIRLVNIPTSLFVVEFGGTSVWVTNWREGKDNSMGKWSEPRPGRVRHSQWGARDAGANEISREERLAVEWWKDRGRGGVVQNFQTGGSDPAKQVISERVRGNESVPCWVVSIEVSVDKSVRGVRKDVRIEGLVRESEGVFLMGGE